MQGASVNDAKEVEKYLNTFDIKNGTFIDLDYTDKARTKWQIKEHWDRLAGMARQYNLPESSRFRDKRVKECIQKGIEYWVKHNYQAPNVWYTLIGIPQEMCKVFLLMDGKLPADLFKASLPIILASVLEDRYNYANAPATGQNLLWETTIHVYASVLSGDHSGLKRAYDASAKEIVVTTKEGIQPDYSFHQHGPQSYSFGYGKSFVLSASQLIYSAKDTHYHFPEETIDILSKYILEGMQWMTRNQMIEYTATGREISRKSYNTGEIIRSLELLAETDKSRSSQYKVFHDQLLKGKRDHSITGNRMFPYIDLMVHHRPEYFFSIKGVSDRIYGTETGNGENLKGYHLGRGTQFIVRHGREYSGIFPLWDWERLPGALNTYGSKNYPLLNWGRNARGNRPFVKGISDGMNGCFGFDYALDSVSARRGWFFMGDVVLNLVSGLSFNTYFNVNQTINQCFSRGNVRIDGKKLTGNLFEGKIKRVWHDSIAYHFVYHPAVNVLNVEQKGSWQDINVSEDPEELSAKIFTLFVDLGTSSDNGSFGYFVVPGVNEAEESQISHIEILRNDRKVQIVWNKHLKKVFIIAYEPVSVTVPYSKALIEFAKPSLRMVDEQGNVFTEEHSIIPE